MKKLISILLAAMMLLSVCTVFAESPEKINIPYDDCLSFDMLLPEGYTHATTVDDGNMMIVLSSENADAPLFLILLCPNDELDEYARLNDLSDEDVAEYAASFTEDLNEPTVTMTETGLGTKVILINEKGAEDDLVILASIYYGLEIAMYCGYHDGRDLTDADIETALQILTDLDFVVAD